jgi:hypothetical protein
VVPWVVVIFVGCLWRGSHAAEQIVLNVNFTPVFEFLNSTCRHGDLQRVDSGDGGDGGGGGGRSSMVAVVGGGGGGWW